MVDIQTNIRENKAPAWGEKPQASGAGSGASPARIYEVYSVEYGLTVKTKNAMRTLRKLTARGFPAYLRVSAGWVLLYPEAVDALERDGEAVVPYMLEPPTFRGCKAYSYVRLKKEDLEG